MVFVDTQFNKIHIIFPVDSDMTEPWVSCSFKNKPGRYTIKESEMNRMISEGFVVDRIFARKNPPYRKE